MNPPSTLPARKYLIPAALLGVAVVGAALLLRHPPAPAAAPQSGAQTHTFQPTAEQLQSLNVTAAAPHRFVARIETEGTVDFNEEQSTAVYSPYTGRVDKVGVQVGDRVKAGAALAYVTAIESAAGVSDLASAAATLDVARASEKRLRELHESGGAAEKDWLQSRADLATAEGSVSAARARLHLLGRTEREIDAIAHDPSAPTSMAITAPVRGTVVERHINNGQAVAPAAGGGSPAFVVADLSSVWLIAYVRETDAEHIARGQTVRVHVPALGRDLTGKVERVAASLDADTHRLQVRVTLPNPGAALKPQMFASASIDTGTAADAIAVPESAVVYEGADARVFVVEGSTVQARSVRVGLHADGQIAILDGLKAGERVVAARALFVDQAVSGD